MRLRYLGFSLFITTVPITHGTLHQSFKEIVSASPYDFIIAGGGTAGCVIANRLSENPNFRVLVLEAGPSNEGALNIEMPGGFGSLSNSAYDWNFTTVPQAGLNGRTFPYARGHVLGGTSAINAMMYTRGSADDYNRWAEVTGDDGWSWKKMLPFILRNERFTSPADGHSTTGQFDPALHDFKGMNSVSLPGFPASLDDTYIQTSKDLKDEFPFDLDMNDGTPHGIGWAQSTIGNGTRSTAATSYLGSRYINRPNLDVVLNSRISRVLSLSNGKDIDLRTVEFMSADQMRTITARKEVILSLGTIGTPHILLNSGIGDEQELEKVGVKPILHLPSVGRNFTDHVHATLSWFANLTVTPVNATTALNQWLDSRTGPYTNGFTNQIAWGRVRNVSSYSIPDPAAGPLAPHYELILHRAPDILPTGESVLGMHTVVSTISSRGFVSLRTNNSFDNPLINPSYLTADTDLLLMKEAIYSAQRLFAGPAWKYIIQLPQGEFANATDERGLENFIRNTSAPVFHAVGTCSMSPKGAHYGVVEPNLLLKSAKGLRIVDASVMPFIPCGHTQAPTYAIAERAAELIKQTWQLL
ncbi:aryl-alcohol oxidase [Cyathus striatus]|nr:aryl-alcohol oxidase [Cyathus striatus]